MHDRSLAHQTYLQSIDANLGTQQRTSPAWLHTLRSTGLAQFTDLGLPSPRQEAWKYTDTGPIERAAYLPVEPGTNGATGNQLNAFGFSDLPCHRLVFVNGYYDPALSTPGAVPQGAIIDSLAVQLRKGPHMLERHLGQYAETDDHGYAALNTAMIADGAFVHLAPGVTLAQPVHILHVTTAAAEARMSHPRNLIVAERDSRAVIIEHHVSIGARHYFTNALTEVVTGDHARIEHYRLQEESPDAYHINGLHVHLGHESGYTAHAFDLGGRLVRNDLHSRLVAEGATCTLNGLYIGAGRRHIDNHTRIDHVQPRGTSREFYKGILNGRARGVFHGRVVVHPQAQHSDAQQVNNNLLLSREAEADSQPQLEIYADDVKCAHGATVGQLDPDALFYLRSRGVDDATAHDLLTYAFARDVLTRIGLEPVRTQLERHLAAGLLHGRSVENPA